jgi:hypothetical protein
MYVGVQEKEVVLVLEHWLDCMNIDVFYDHYRHHHHHYYYYCFF